MTVSEQFCSCGVSSLGIFDLLLLFQQENDFAKRIEEVKPMFVEPRNKGRFSEVDYLHYIPLSFSEIVSMFNDLL